MSISDYLSQKFNSGLYTTEELITLANKFGYNLSYPNASFDASLQWCFPNGSKLSLHNPNGIAYTTFATPYFI